MRLLRYKLIRDLTIRGRAQATIRSYVQSVKGLANYYHLSPDLLNQEQIQDFLFYLATEKNCSNGTLNKVAYALRFFFHTTLERPKVDFVIPSAKKQKALPVILSRDEIEVLFVHAENLRDLSLVMLGYGVGLRISEVVNLRVEDLDGSRRTIHVRSGKGNKDRMAGLPDRLYHTLRKYWLAYRPECWLFPSRKFPQRHITDAGARVAFEAIRKKSGINKKYTFHSLRHAFATHLVEAGKDLRAVQQLMGHKDITSTLIYIHLAKGMLTTLDSPLDLPHESTG